MAVIHLVIADKDRAYLDSLVDFIYSKYNNRFMFRLFPTRILLTTFLIKRTKLTYFL